MSSVSTIGKNKILTVRSEDRAYGSPSNFAINIGQFNLNPKYCSWHQVALPNGFFNINRNSNTLSITVYDSSSVAWVVTIGLTQGNYNTTNLATSVQSALNAQLKSVNAAAPTSFFTVTIDGNNNYCTLSCSTSGWSFSVNANVASLDWILGFRSTQPSSSYTLVTSAKGNVICDLRNYPNIYIRSSIVGGNYVHAKGTDSVLCVVQNTALYGQTIFQRSPTADLDIFAVTGQLGQISFQLVDEYGNELPMDTNQEWEISLGLYD